MNAKHAQAGIVLSALIALGVSTATGSVLLMMPDSVAATRSARSQDAGTTAAPFVAEPLGRFDDCNQNGIPDDQDIANGTSQDCNGNGVPDECEALPGPPLAGMTLWLRADRGVNVVQSAVTEWWDQSGAGHHFFLNSPSAAPSHLESAQNGRPVVHFPTNAYLTNTGRLITGSYFTIFSVVNVISGDYPWELGAGAGGPRVFYERGYYGGGDPGRLDIAHDNGDDVHAYYADISGLQVFRVISVVANDTLGATEVFVDGNPATCDGSGTHWAVGGGGNHIGCMPNSPTGAVESEFAEFIVYDRALTAGERQQVEAYLLARYFGTFSGDCNQNGIPDDCDIADCPPGDPTCADCNANGVPDACDIAAGTTADCNHNGIPDGCDALPIPDCNTNCIADVQDIASGTSQDCNGNGVPDECEHLAWLPVTDGLALWLRAESLTGYADGDPVGFWHDESGSGLDLSQSDPIRKPRYYRTALNGRPVLRFGGSAQMWLQRDNVAGSDLTSTYEATVFFVAEQTGGNQRNALFGWGTSPNRFLVQVTYDDVLHLQHGDPNAGGKAMWPQPPEWDDVYHRVQFYRNVTTAECTIDGTPLAPQTISDTPEVTELHTFYVGRSMFNEYDGWVAEIIIYRRALSPIERQAVDQYLYDRYFTQPGGGDCNANGVLDECDIDHGTSLDCNSNAIPDECDLAGGNSTDCNANGVPDECDIAAHTSADCNQNGIPDECDIANCPVGNHSCADCNSNGVPDSCDIASGSSRDLDVNGIPDECQSPGRDVWYVNAAATGLNNGTSWDNAFNSLQDAIAVAQPGDAIWVAHGTYKPYGSVVGPSDPGRDISFLLQVGRSLYGGFAGTEASLSQRTVPIPVEHTTVLSGDLNGDDGEPGGTNAENSYNVVWCENTDSTPRLDGFTVRGGNAASGYGDTDMGGGLFIRNASPFIVNCTIQGNSAGWGLGGGSGSMYVGGTSSLRVLNCDFIENVTQGAFVNADAGDQYFVNCVFSGNASYGLSFFGGGQPHIINCTFSHDFGGPEISSWLTPCPEILNSIVWGGISVSCALVDHCCIQGGWGGAGGANIDSDPLFTAADGYRLHADGDLRLRKDAAGTSPCIDAGVDAAVPGWITTDIEGVPRLVDGNGDEIATVDMGAYEYHGYCENCPGMRVWLNPLGGLFSDYHNWSLSAPDSRYPALFTLDNTYTVTFDQNAASSRLIVWGGNVTFDFGTAFQSYALSSTSSAGALVLGERSGDTATLTIVGNGQLSTAFGSAASIASAENSTAALSVSGPLAAAFFGGDLCIGCAGDGTLDISGGAKVTMFIGAIADLPGSTGSVHVGGTESSLDVPFFLVVGNSTPLGPSGPVASLVVEDGGRVDVGPGGILVLQNGQIRGDGTINGDVTSIGGIQPGMSPGTLTINGEYEQVSRIPGYGLDSGRLILEVNGAEAGQYDQLVVNGEIKLGGGLFVQSPPGFDPPSGLDLPLIVAAVRQPDSHFDVGFFPGITGNRFLTLTYAARGAGDVHLVTLPLPGGIDMQDPQNIALSGAPNSVGVGDLDGDSQDDLVVTLPGQGRSPGTAVVLLTRFQNGQYAPLAQTYAMGTEPCAVAVGEFDGQPGLDIAVANAGSDNVMVLTNIPDVHGHGTGTFNPVTPATTFAVGHEPRGLATADYNKDGYADLAVANTADDTVEILLGGGERGLFVPWSDLLHTPAGAEPAVFTVDPFDPDDDTDDDIAVACRNGTVVLFVNRYNPPDEWTFGEALSLSVGNGPVQLLTGNLLRRSEHEPRADLVTVNRDDGTVSVLLDTSPGRDVITFAPAVDLPVRTNPIGSEPRSAALIDLDDDGDLDIAVVSRNDQDMFVARVLRNDLSGGQLAFAPAADLDAGTEPLAVVSADLNGDGRADLVAINGTFLKDGSRSGSVVIRLNGPMLCPGDSDCNGQVGFSDIDYFVEAIPDNEAAWRTLYAARHGGAEPICSYLNNDCTGDGHVDFADIDPFVALIPSSCP